MQVGEMFVAVRPDTKGFAGDLNQELGQAGQRASTSLGQALTAGAAIAGMSRLVGAASDLNEAVNVTGLIFTESRASIDAFAEGAAQSLGQSETAARSATATFGGLLQNLGMTEAQSADLSMQLTTLASDLGSAFNEDPAVAVTALASALRGETEPIRQFNVQLSDMAVRQEAVRLGLADSTAAVDANGLVQGRLSLIMAQTSAVQGDFANTATEAANAQRIAAAEAENAAASTGSNFLPVYKQGVAVVQSLARAFGALPGPIQTIAVLLAAGTAVRGPLTNAYGAIGDSVRAMAGRFRDAGGGIKGLSAAITPGALGVGAAVVGIGLITQGLAENAAQAEENAAEITRLGDAFAEAGARGASEAILGTLREDAPEVIDSLARLGITVRDLVDAETGVDPSRLAELRDIVQGLPSEQAVILAAQLSQLGIGIEQAASSEGQLESSTGSATVTLADQATALSEVADAASAAHDQLDALFGIQQTADEAAVALQEAADGLTASLQENGRTFDIATDAGRSNMAAAREQATAIRDYTIAMIANGASAQDATAAQNFLTGGLRNTLRQAGLTDGEIRDLIRTYASVPGKVKTDLDANSANAENAINRVKTKLSDLDGDSATVYVNAQLAAGVAQFLTGYASGGPVAGGRTIVVGERGPELFVPSSNGRIIPNHQLGGTGGREVSSGGAGGPAVTVNFYGDIVGDTELAQRIAPAIARELGYMERGN